MLKAIPVILASCFLFSISYAFANSPFNTMGEESFGNKALSAANYKKWPGLAKLVNNKHRVYQQWVNGSEFCCYRGSMDDMNNLLKEYSEIKCDKHELVLLPGPGIAKSFQRNEVNYDLKVDFIQGIAAQMTSEDQSAARIWKAWPVVTIRLNESIDLSRLKIPESVAVLQLQDLERDALAGIASKNSRVRARSCSVLASLNPYDEQNMLKLTEMVKDEMFVATCALSALAHYEAKAKENQAVYKLVKSYTNSPESNLKQYSIKTLKAIESATLEPGKEAAFQKQLQTIKDFCLKK